MSCGCIKQLHSWLVHFTCVECTMTLEADDLDKNDTSENEDNNKWNDSFLYTKS